MIITFIGTDKGNNSAKKAALLTAGLLSLSNNKKVCLLQLGYDPNDMTNFLIGKEKKSDLAASMDSFGTTEMLKGLDALMSKANSLSTLPADTLYTAAESMVTTENRFDVLNASRKENFDAELKSENKLLSLSRILNSMSDPEKEAILNPYDYVIMYVPKSCPRLEKIIPLSDVNVCCIRQGDREEPMLNEKNNIFLVTHFDENSVFDLKYIKKAYSKDVKNAKMFAMPHNVSFKDACTAMDVRKWLTKNYNITDDDDNFDFISKMQTFVDFISDSDAEVAPEPTAKRMKAARREAKERRAIRETIEKSVEQAENQVPVEETWAVDEFPEQSVDALIRDAEEPETQEIPEAQEVIEESCDTENSEATFVNDFQSTEEVILMEEPAPIEESIASEVEVITNDTMEEITENTASIEQAKEPAETSTEQDTEVPQTSPSSKRKRKSTKKR